MTILWAVIAGLIIGLLAKLVLPGRQPVPLWLTVVLGIIGGLLGNGLASAFGVADTNGVDWIRHALQIGAAAVLISLITPLYTGRGHRHHHRF
ncbi:GlsB/YeaQ/YmgE family stress response membrane protein [Streptomyces sp. NPDC021020]|uniref:GlsB/YeaQ/YmgE family stress response membrane protein n=1 Tax=Streptomyces sp. NPDC021020 TaxID=3365109 RepID=UPI00379E2565